LTPRHCEVLDYNESLLNPPETVSNIRVDGNHRVADSPNTIQLARERLRRSFSETSGVNRAESIITPRDQLQARTGDSEVDVIIVIVIVFLIVSFLSVTNEDCLVR